MIQLGLIYKKGTTKQQKNKAADVGVYSYTTLGHTTAWFVKRLDKDFKQVATDKIYNLTQSLHYAHDSYKNVSQSKFLAKSRENGLYDKLDKMQELVIPEKDHIIASSYLALFESVITNIGSFEEISEQYMNTYIDTIKSLDEKAQKVVLLYGKLAVERVVTNITREWEELMLDNISNYSKVTLVADCMLCMQVYPVTVDYIEYLKFRTKSPNDYMTMDCDKCKGSNCLNVAEW